MLLARRVLTLSHPGLADLRDSLYAGNKKHRSPIRLVDGLKSLTMEIQRIVEIDLGAACPKQNFLVLIALPDRPLHSHCHNGRKSRHSKQALRLDGKSENLYIFLETMRQRTRADMVTLKLQSKHRWARNDRRDLRQNEPKALNQNPDEEWMVKVGQ